MALDNLEELKEQLYRKGFGYDHTPELTDKLNSGIKEFTIEHYATMKNGDEMGYRIEFGRGGPEEKAYLNGFTAGLLKNVDSPGIVREHHFPSRFMVTAAEAYRMLKHGLQVAVNKNLYNKEGQQYNTWMSIDVRGAKDEYGNYPEKSFHQNYYGGTPFEPKDALQKFKTPIMEVQYPMQLKKVDERLRKAQIVPVIYRENNEEKKGFVTVDVENAGANLHNEKMEVIEAVSLPRKAIKQSQSETPASAQTPAPSAAPQQPAVPEQAPRQPDELKKKPGEQIEWSKKSQGKGMKW